MHTTRKWQGVWAIAAGLIVALALTGVVAFAAEWVTGTRTITVNLPSNIEADVKNDIASADVVLDIYRIGSATANDQAETYDLKGATGKLQAALDAGDWTKMAAVGLEEVKAGNAVQAYPSSFAPGDTITLGSDASADGIFLILPHGKNEAGDSLKAYGNVFEYTFQPSIVTLPTKDDVDENQHINSAYGNWITEGKAVVKLETKHRFGDLELYKTVERFNGDMVSFVYDVVQVDPQTHEVIEGGYHNFASIHYKQGDKVASTQLRHIPADITVKVEEVYTGSHDEKSAGNEAQFVYIQGGNTVEGNNPNKIDGGFVFKNEPDDTPKYGHGIENHFKMNKDGDWHWNPSHPDKAKGDEVVNAHQDAAGETQATDQSAESK